MNEFILIVVLSVVTTLIAFIFDFALFSKRYKALENKNEQLKHIIDLQGAEILYFNDRLSKLDNQSNKCNVIYDPNKYECQHCNFSKDCREGY